VLNLKKYKKNGLARTLTCSFDTDLASIVVVAALSQASATVALIATR
jgi:hypothetical protein